MLDFPDLFVFVLSTLSLTTDFTITSHQNSNFVETMRVGSRLTLLTNHRFPDLHTYWRIYRYTREYYINAGGVHTTPPQVVRQREPLT